MLVLCIPAPYQLPDSLGLVTPILSSTVTELDFVLCEDAGVSFMIEKAPGLGLSFHLQLRGMAVDGYLHPLLWVPSPDQSCAEFGFSVPPAAVGTFGTGTNHWYLHGEIQGCGCGARSLSSRCLRLSSI